MDELAAAMDEFAAPRTGELAGFERRMLEHQRPVIRLALRLLGNTDDAREAAQEVFFRLYKYGSGLRSEEAVSAWLYRTTVNVCHDLRRRRVFEPIEAVPEPQVDGGAFEALSLAGRREILERALEHLPEKERAAIVLREIEGLSTRETAEALGSTETTVRSQISQARARLRGLCAALMRRRR